MAMTLLERTALALPVLRNMLNKEGLTQGRDIADDLLADIRAHLNQPAQAVDAAPSIEASEAMGAKGCPAVEAERRAKGKVMTALRELAERLDVLANSVTEVRWSDDFVFSQAAIEIRAYADLLDQIERAQECVTDEVDAIACAAYLNAKCGHMPTEMHAALQAVAHLLPSERGGKSCG